MPGLCQPCIEVRCRARANDAAKVADEALGGGDGRAFLTERFAVGAFVLVKVFNRAQQEPVCLSWGESMSLGSLWRSARCVLGLSTPSWVAWSGAPGTQVLA